MATAASKLEEIVDQLKQNNVLTTSVLKNVSSLNNTLSVFFTGQKRESLKALERSREASKAKPRPTSAASSASVAGGGVGGFLGGKLGGLAGGLLAGILSAGGVGLAAAGVGIAAFLGSMAGADAAIAKLGTGENLKSLLENIAGGLAAFDNDSLKALGGLFAGSALFAVITGMSGSFKGMLGIAIIGAGIAAFLGSFAGADVAISELGSSGEALKKFAGNFADAIRTFDGVSLQVAALLAGGALFGMAAAGMGGKGKGALGRSGKALIGGGLGIAVIGAGIAAFVTTLALGEAGLDKMKSTGSTFKTFAQNVADGMKAFNDAGISKLLANGAIFGFVTGAVAGRAKTGPLALKAGLGAIVGLGVVGLAISAFMLGIAAGDAGIKIVGADGSGFKNLATGIADGLRQFTDLPDGIGDKLAGIGGGLAALYGANALGGITTEFGNMWSKTKKFVIDAWNWLTGSDVQYSGSAIQQMVNTLEPLKTLDDKIIENLDKLGAALGRFTQTFRALAGSEIGDFGKGIARLMQGLGVVSQILPLMLNGGSKKVELPGGSKPTIDFGDEGQGGLLNPNIDYDKIKNSINKVYDALGIDRLENTRRDVNFGRMTPAAFGGAGGFGPRISNTVGTSIGSINNQGLIRGNTGLLSTGTFIHSAD